jgi:hypothetical protein
MTGHITNALSQEVEMPFLEVLLPHVKKCFAIVQFPAPNNGFERNHPVLPGKHPFRVDVVCPASRCRLVGVGSQSRRLKLLNRQNSQTAEKFSRRLFGISEDVRRKKPNT